MMSHFDIHIKQDNDHDIVIPFPYHEDRFRDANGVWVINGISVEDFNEAAKRAVESFKGVFGRDFRKALQDFSVSYHAIGKNIAEAIGGGINHNIKVCDAFEDVLEDRARKCRAQRRYRRMCENMPPPRRRKHGGRLSKKARKL